MLAVAVDGDDAAKGGQLLAHIRKGGFQGAALALVNRMGQHGTIGKFGSLIEKVPSFLAAAVIHDNDMLKAFPEKAFNNSLEFLVRVQRGQHDGRAFPTVRPCSVLVQLGVFPLYYSLWVSGFINCCIKIEKQAKACVIPSAAGL